MIKKYLTSSSYDEVQKTEEAASHVLCHDITQIIPGRFKGTAFRKAI